MSDEEIGWMYEQDRMRQLETRNYRRRLGGVQGIQDDWFTPWSEIAPGSDEYQYVVDFYHRRQAALLKAREG